MAEKPTVTFIISLIGGVITLLAGLLVTLVRYLRGNATASHLSCTRNQNMPKLRHHHLRGRPVLSAVRKGTAKIANQPSKRREEDR